MKATIKHDGLHISGYVNVPGRESRPVITRYGRVNEVIEQRAFQRAIEKANNIVLKLDHERAIASTKDGTLRVYEDAVGLRAEAVVTDKETVAGARAGKLKGWSFNILQAKDTIEERAGKFPLRTIKDFTMTEVTLAMRKQPAYASNSIEFRASEDEDAEVEYRCSDEEVEVRDITPIMDYGVYENKIKTIQERKVY